MAKMKSTPVTASAVLVSGQTPHRVTLVILMEITILMEIVILVEIVILIVVVILIIVTITMIHYYLWYY